MSMSTGQSGYASQPYGAPAQPVTQAERPPQGSPAVPGVAAPTIGRRVGAYAIDAAILGVIGVVATVIVILVVQAEVVAAITEARPLALWTIPVLMIPGVVGLAIALAYSAMQGSSGSVGQRALGIRLVRADTSAPLGFWRAVWRNIVWGAACIIIVGYFTPLFGAAPQRRGWHDLASGAVMTVRGGVAEAPAPAAADVTEQPDGAEAAQEYRREPSAPGEAFAAPSGSAPVDPFASSQSPLPIDPFAVPAPIAQPDPAAAPPVPPVPPVPAPPAPAPVPESAPSPSGPIAFVPGVTGERDEQPQAEPSEPAVPQFDPAPAAPAAPAFDAPPAPAPAAESAPVPVPASVVSPASDIPPAPAASAPAPAPAAPDFPDDTVVLNHAPAPTDVPSVVLVWDDGTRTEVTSRTVFGRNPVAAGGADVVAIADDTLSLSKTHFEVAIDGEAASILDRHSTNGVVIVRAGTSTTLVPDRAAPLAAGDRITIGDRTVSVERAGKS